LQGRGRVDKYVVVAVDPFFQKFHGIKRVIQPPNNCFLLLCDRDFTHAYFLSFFFNGQYRGAVFP
jgi:hypothetical protein